MPTAAIVPNAVAITEDKIAKIKVFLSAARVASLSKSSAYQRSENPANNDVLFEELKEKITITAKGAYKNISMSAI